ncbi:DUF58 domain-containing protein [Thermococcus sp.]|uniref:DUF58 domain-containing protein n=1 Tax=Thermococcus sp. TaxID=35749 RepID=UPI002630D24B|nr:DUF58 domain-containing protein [Thermococcus sp.]
MRRFLGYALWSIFLGVALLSPGMEVLAVVPLMIIFIGSLLSPPEVIEVRRTLSRDTVMRGGQLEETIRVRSGRGIGIILLRLPVPAGVRTERVTFVGFKGPGEAVLTFVRKLRFEVPGRQSLPEAEVLTVNPLFVRFNWIVSGKRPGLHVLPSSLPRRYKIPGTRRRRPRYAVSGKVSMDFREVRDYQPGDPLKKINWKASARFGRILVNEFEREGSGTVFIVIDVESLSTLGEGRFVELLSALVSYLTGLEYHVGFYLYGLGRFVPPSAGIRAVGDVLREVFAMWEEAREETPSALIEFIRGYSSRYLPTVIFVTSLFEENFGRVSGTIGLLKSAIRARIVSINVAPTVENPLVLMENRGLAWELSKISKTVHWHQENVSSVLKEISGVIS